jgi:hypothetical protein
VPKFKIDLMVGCILPLNILLCAVRIKILGVSQRPLGIGPETECEQESCNFHRHQVSCLKTYY